MQCTAEKHAAPMTRSRSAWLDVAKRDTFIEVPPAVRRTVVREADKGGVTRALEDDRLPTGAVMLIAAILRPTSRGHADSTANGVGRVDWPQIWANSTRETTCWGRRKGRPRRRWGYGGGRSRGLRRVATEGGRIGVHIGDAIVSVVKVVEETGKILVADNGGYVSTLNGIDAHGHGTSKVRLMLGSAKPTIDVKACFTHPAAH